MTRLPQHAIALEAHQFAVVSAARPCNQAKNRSLSSIPMEPSRVCLTPRIGLEGADYINASWLPGKTRPPPAGGALLQ